MALPGLMTTTYTVKCDEKGVIKEQISSEKLTRKPSKPVEDFSFETLLKKLTIKKRSLPSHSLPSSPPSKPSFSSPKSILFPPTESPVTAHSSRVDIHLTAPKVVISPRKRPFSKLNIVIKDCSEVQEALMPIWNRANTTVSGQRRQLRSTRDVLQKATEESHNIWKTNLAYCTSRLELERRLKAQESLADREANEFLSHFIGVKTSSHSPPPSDMASIRSLHVAQLLRRNKRGFGQSFATRASAPVSPSERKTTVVRKPFKRETEEEALLREIKEYRLAEIKAKTPAPILISPKSDLPIPKNSDISLHPGNELNEFIWRERGKYHSKSISDLNKKKRMMLEAKMERIAPSPDVLRKAKLLMAKEQKNKPLKATRIDNLHRNPFSEMASEVEIEGKNRGERRNTVKENSAIERWFQSSNKKQELVRTLKRMTIGTYIPVPN